MAFLAKVAEIKGVHPFQEWLKVLRFIGDKAGFEVSSKRAFGTQSGSGEIGRADEGLAPVHDHGLGVNARAENPLEEIAFDQCRISIEVLSKPRAGFLGVEESDCDPSLNKV